MVDGELLARFVLWRKCMRISHLRRSLEISWASLLLCTWFAKATESSYRELSFDGVIRVTFPWNGWSTFQAVMSSDGCRSAQLYGYGANTNDQSEASSLLLRELSAGRSFEGSASSGTW